MDQLTPEIEIYCLIYKTLQGGGYTDAAKLLYDDLQKNLHITRSDYNGQQHESDLKSLLSNFPHINSRTLIQMCHRLNDTLDKELPPSLSTIRTFLGDGQYSMLRTKQSLRLNTLRLSSKALFSDRILSPAYTEHSVNLFKHIQARRIRGPSEVRRAYPAEIFTHLTRFKKVMGHLSAVYCLCFDQTGQYIFTGADDHLIKIWSARDGRLLKTLRGHAGEITDMSVNFENRVLASGGMDKVIRIWDLRTSKLLECLSTHTAMVTSVKFSPYNRNGDKRYLVSTSNDGSVIFWEYHKDTLGFKFLQRFKERNRPGGRIVCSSHSTGGSFLACGSSDNYIHVYGFNPQYGPYWIGELDAHKDQVDSIQFSNHGFRFVTGSIDGSAIIWSYKSNKWTPLRLDMSTRLDQSIPNIPPDVAKTKVLIVQWSRDDRYVITSIADYSIKVWDSKTGRLIHILDGHESDVYLIESHPTDPRIFLSASHDGSIIIWDIERGRTIKKFINKAEPLEIQGDVKASIYDLKFSPDGNMIAATDSYGCLSLFGYGQDDAYRDIPSQMFFHTDYRALIRDMRNFVLDDQTHVAPHLMPRPTLVDMNGDPHPPELQYLVPDYQSGERTVIPSLSDEKIRIITQNIANHSKLEDDEYVQEMSFPLSDVDRNAGPSTALDSISPNNNNDDQVDTDSDQTVIDSDATEIDEEPRPVRAIRVRSRRMTRSAAAAAGVPSYQNRYMNMNNLDRQDRLERRARRERRNRQPRYQRHERHNPQERQSPQEPERRSARLRARKRIRLS